MRRITKGMTLLLLVCLAGLSFAWAQPDGLPTGAVQPAPQQFQDLSPDHWAADAIDRLTALGVLTGYPNGTFGGARAATRYELAVVAARLLDLLSTSITDLISDPNFQRAIEDAATNNERLLRLEQLIENSADTEFVLDLAERLALIEEYLNQQAGADLFPGLSSLDDLEGLSVAERDPLSDEEMAAILSQLEQQLDRSRSLALPDAYFGITGGHPVIGSVHVGLRNIFTENLGARLGVGYGLPGSFAIELAAFYEFDAIFGTPASTLYVGPGVLVRVGSTASLDLELLLGLEYSLPGGPVSLIVEMGPGFELTPAAGNATFVARAGMNYGF